MGSEGSHITGNNNDDGSVPRFMKAACLVWLLGTARVEQRHH